MSLTRKTALVIGSTGGTGLQIAQSAITCNCVSSAYVWTPLVESQAPDTMKARRMSDEEAKRDVILAAWPTKEFAAANQLAGLMRFLTSENASQITGANLSADGGWTAA